MSDVAAAPSDPASLIRSRRYRALLVLAALIGILVSLASWCFLELVHVTQVGVFEDLPGWLGLHPVPLWWPLPVLAVAGLIVAFAIVRLPGHGGHVPAEGLKTGAPAQPVDLPGILLAALATLGLGLVLGPEAPLIALGMGLAIFAIRSVKKDSPDEVVTVLAAAGAFAAISTIFGSPVIGAVILIEAAGLGGPTLPLVLLPGLIAAGIGSLVFIGMGTWTGLSASAYSLGPLPLPALAAPDFADFVWTIVFAIVAAVVVFAVLEIAKWAQRLVGKRQLLLLPVAGLVVAVLAIAFSQTTGQPVNLVLFSGQDAFTALAKSAPALSVSTLALLILFKGLAWGVSMGNFRGGPTFPALFVGAVGGFLVAGVPGFGETPAVAALIGAAAVSVLRLPLSCIVIALLLVSNGGLATAPLIIVGVAVAYITTLSLSALRTKTTATEPEDAAEAA